MEAAKGNLHGVHCGKSHRCHFVCRYLGLREAEQVFDDNLVQTCVAVSLVELDCGRPPDLHDRDVQRIRFNHPDGAGYPKPHPVLLLQGLHGVLAALQIHAAGLGNTIHVHGDRLAGDKLHLRFRHRGEGTDGNTQDGQQSHYGDHGTKICPRQFFRIRMLDLCTDCVEHARKPARLIRTNIRSPFILIEGLIPKPQPERFREPHQTLLAGLRDERILLLQLRRKGCGRLAR
mmetsp:Transcript_61342/g.110382  ORF Transcript_61342/g.110382 Transcript_61342/m.110382 type:complete len:232 (-) Transcript_61342:48-743(-)